MEIVNSVGPMSVLWPGSEPPYGAGHTLLNVVLLSHRAQVRGLPMGTVGHEARSVC